MQADGKALGAWRDAARCRMEASPVSRQQQQQRTSSEGDAGKDAALKWDECVRTWQLLREAEAQARVGDVVGDHVGGAGDGDGDVVGDVVRDLGTKAGCILHRRGLIWELMPMLWTLRFCMMLPVSFSKDGSIYFRWRSTPMVLTFLAWMVTAVVGYFCIRFYMDPVYTDRHFHVRDLVPQYCNAFNMSYIFCMPYTSWATTAKAITMLDQWQRVERLVSALRGSMPVPGLRRRVWLYVVLSFLFPVGMCLLTLGLYSYEEAWMAPILVHLFSYSMLATCFWNLTCRGVASVAVLQAAHLGEDFQRMGIAALRSHREVWLSMARVLQLLTVCWGRTHAVLLLLSFVSFVSIAFLAICMALARDYDNRIIWLTSALMYCFGIATSVCNSAQIATDAMRKPSTKQLLLLSLVHRDADTTTEIWRFLQDISLTSPRVTVTGLAILSRATIISFFALANTYLFVVSQFAISVETTQSNFSEDPFLLMDGM